MSQNKPVAWARARALQGHYTGRLRPVTIDRLLDDDVPLYRISPRKKGDLVDRLRFFGEFQERGATNISFDLRLHGVADEITRLEELLGDCVASLAGYRRERNDTQPCDAERAALAWFKP